MIVLLFLLLLVPAVASAQQGPGLWQAAPGTQISQCTNIGSPVANRTWCADGNNNPLYRWRVWDGTQYIAVGGDGGGVCGFSGQVTIADSATTALVTFGVPQATADYFVVVSTVPVSGTPLGVFAWAHDQTINGFTVEISGPPLVGNVIGVNWQVSSGSCGGTGPSLPDTSVQFNNAGAFGGDSNLLWNNTLKRLQIGSLPLGTLAPGPLVVGSVAPSGTAQQAGLFQIISGTSVGAGPVTLSQDNVAVSGWSFAGADSVNATYGGNFGVHFLGPGQSRGVEIDVQNEFGDAGIGAFGQHIGLWLNRSGTYNASSAISIASQDPRGWWYGLHFAPGNAGTGTDTLIKGWGIYYFRAMPNQMIGIVPSDDNNPDDAMITVFAFNGTTEKSKLDKRGRFYSRGDDTGVTQPAFTFIDEPNTGIYMPAAGQLGLAVTGTEVFKAVTTPVTGTLTHGYITSFGTVFASLGTVINGAIIYCSDCAQTLPCTGGGTGAFAQGINAAWSCTSGTSAGAGTVTSVAMTVPSILSVAGSPITTAGTLAVTLATQTANTVFAGPTSGGAATPTFRALLTSDLPSAAKIKTCVVTIGDPGAASAVLADDNDSPVACPNNWGADWTITSVGCWADAGTPTVTPILTGGTGTSILTGALTCGTASWAAGTLNGTPVVHSFSGGATCSSTPCSADVNITTAGGVAKYIVVKIAGTL